MSREESATRSHRPSRPMGVVEHRALDSAWKALLNGKAFGRVFALKVVVQLRPLYPFVRPVVVRHRGQPSINNNSRQVTKNLIPMRWLHKTNPTIETTPCGRTYVRGD